MAVDAGRESVKDSAGHRHAMAQLVRRLPAMVFLGTLHVDVCKRIASSMGYQGLHYRVFVNLLVKHSRPARQITALISLVRHGDIELRTVDSRFATRSVLREFIDMDGVQCSHEHLHCGDFLRQGALLKLLVKTLLHRGYRLFFSPGKAASASIRSWVEITEKMYGDRYRDARVLIYPFYLNLPRHLKYLRRCFRQYPRVTLCGLPYNPLHWVRLAVAPRNFDAAYLRFEIEAYRRHGSELAQQPGHRLYTSDEFEAGALAMVEAIRERGGEVVNTAHGLSFGCPYVAYNDFAVYNTAQETYYAKHSPDTRFVVSPRINAGEADRLNVARDGARTIIYIEANYRSLGMTFEADLQDRIIAAIARLAESGSLAAVIKAHPNRSQADYADYRRRTGLDIVRHLNELGTVAPVFVTIASAAYYDFRQYGPFVFIDDGYSDLNDFYGENLQGCSIDELPGAIDAAFS